MMKSFFNPMLAKVHFPKFHSLLSNTPIMYKIMLTVVIAVLIPMITSTYISGRMVSGKIEEAEKARLFNTLDSFTFYIEDYSKKARDNASILSNAAELRLYCTNGNNIAASQFLVQLASEIGMDFAMVADKDKRLLTRTDRPLESGIDLSEDKMIKSGFAGFININMYPSASGIVIQAVSPIKSSTAATGVNTIGAIITQYNIDRRFVESIKKISKAEITLYADESIISTFTAEKESDSLVVEELRISNVIREKLVMTKEKQIEKKVINGRQYYVGYNPILNNRSEIIGVLSIAIPQEEAAAAKIKVQMYIFLVGLIGIIFAVLFAVIMSRNIVNPIKRLVLDTKTIAGGNLNYKTSISGKDEVGQLAAGFNEMAESLRKLVDQVLKTVTATGSSTEAVGLFVNEVNEISVEVENISEKVKHGSQTQCEYLDQTNGEMVHVSTEAVEISSRTLDITRQANIARQVVEKESGSLKERSYNMTDRIGNFKLNLQQIRMMVEIVTSIAAQTKLLSLNAAIEAARAGAAGRGFGVVAAEIRKLSDESGSSIVAMKEIIKSLFDEMDATKNDAENSAYDFERCIGISKGIEKSFDEIVEAFNLIDSGICDISSKADMQAMKIDKVSSIMKDVGMIAQRAQERSELMHEGAASQSRLLGELVEELFKLKCDIEKTHMVTMNLQL